MSLISAVLSNISHGLPLHIHSIYPWRKMCNHMKIAYTPIKQCPLILLYLDIAQLIFLLSSTLCTVV